MRSHAILFIIHFKFATRFQVCLFDLFNVHMQEVANLASLFIGLLSVDSVGTFFFGVYDEAIYTGI